MAADEAINQAINIIGDGKPDDYIISPTSHAGEFKDRAPDLAAILSSSAVAITARQFEETDRTAIDYQNQYKHVFSRANATVLLTSALTALVLATSILLNDSNAPTLKRVLVISFSIGVLVTGALASRYLFLIKQGRYLENWMSKRALAETSRLDYFKTVANAPAPSMTGNGVPVDLLKLEYFRRFQLDVQLTYFRVRAKRHRDEAARTLSYGGWAMAFAAIVVGVGGLLGAVDPRFAAIAALGTFFAGLSSYATLRETVSQDQRNADRYERTARVLEDINKRLDDVRTAVKGGGAGPLNDFIEAVHEQLSLEHKQWLDELRESQDAYLKLQNTLKEYSDKISPDAKKSS